MTFTVVFSEAAEKDLGRLFDFQLIIPFGATGYVALYEIANRTTVVVLAVRHQREEDYH